MGYKLGLVPDEVKSAGQLVGSIPYEPERKFSAASYEKKGITQIAAKEKRHWLIPSLHNRGIHAMRVQGITLVVVNKFNIIHDQPVLHFQESLASLSQSPVMGNDDEGGLIIPVNVF